jgi:hypothetical protein
MSDRGKKLRRLERFRRSVPHVTCSALSAILKEARNGIPEVADRMAIQEARDLQSHQNTEYGKLIVEIPLEKHDGSSVPLVIVNPFAHFYVAASECEGFAKMLRRQLAITPCSQENPWHLIIYADEVVPGNQL